MIINVDKTKLSGKYDERYLTISKSGTRKYPSKRMFVEFLKQYKDVKGTVDIWSLEDHVDGTVTINIELKYKVPNIPLKKMRK